MKILNIPLAVEENSPVFAGLDINVKHRNGGVELKLVTPHAKAVKIITANLCRMCRNAGIVNAIELRLAPGKKSPAWAQALVFSAATSLAILKEIDSLVRWENKNLKTIIPIKLFIRAFSDKHHPPFRSSGYLSQ